MITHIIKLYDLLGVFFVFKYPKSNMSEPVVMIEAEYSMRIVWGINRYQKQIAISINVRMNNPAIL